MYKNIKSHPISIEEIQKSRSIVYKHIKPTQLIHYPDLSKLIGAKLFIKHENHNLGGAFKIRGSINLMHHLVQNNVKGVITFSTGNHGLSVSIAARRFGLDSVVVVPQNNNPLKNKRIIENGAELIESGNTFEEASQTVEKLCMERNLYYVHPADEPHLINGVGTEFLEIIDELSDVDVVIIPIGAGSEAAAAVTVLKSVNKNIEIIAVQAQESPAAFKSWKAGSIASEKNNTFAGGFATGKGYETTFNIYKNNLNDFILLSEDEIYRSIAMSFYYTQNIVEGAGSSTLMAAYKLRNHLRDKTVVLQMSGGNLSYEELEKAMSYSIFQNGIIADNSEY